MRFLFNLFVGLFIYMTLPIKAWNKSKEDVKGVVMTLLNKWTYCMQSQVSSIRDLRYGNCFKYFSFIYGIG